VYDMRVVTIVTSSIFAALLVPALALALVGFGCTGTAAAQTMGEYGGVTAQGAGAASSMPRIGAPDFGKDANSAGNNPSGRTHSEDIRTFEGPATDQPEKNQRVDTNSSQDDWQQVK